MNKFKIDFEKWAEKQPLFSRNKHGVLMYGCMAFYDMGFSLQWGIYTDFFDSVGIQIEDEGYWRYDIKIYNWRIFCSKAGNMYRGLEYNNRIESRLDVLEKVKEVYNI